MQFKSVLKMLILISNCSVNNSYYFPMTFLSYSSVIDSCGINKVFYNKL